MDKTSNVYKLALYKERAIRRARSSFWDFRCYINPKMKKGWWQKEVAEELQQFERDLEAGLRPKLVIQAPPQHGKSVQIVEFLAWLAGKNPDLKSIYTSFSERLGIRANLMLQRIFDSAKYKEIFPDTFLNSSNTVTKSAQCLRNREILEYVGHTGYFRNTTVQGSITGESLDLGIIDDPIKGREQANSATVRNKAWDWFTDDFFTRFSEDAGLLCILTRWHVDDPIGRLLERMNDVKLLSYPAIAVEDEPNRRAGDALFPEHKSRGFLLERKAVMPDSNWQSLYQQNPFVQGGELFKDAWWQTYDHEAHIPFEWRAIFADTAQKTNQANDYTTFQCWGYFEGRAYLIDQFHQKVEAPELLTNAKAFWAKHVDPTNRGYLRAMYIEDKVSGTGLIQQLAREGIPVEPISRSSGALKGDKVSRANDVLTYFKTGLVYIPESTEWVMDYRSEFSMFPNGAHDDQIDPTVDAVMTMLGGSYSLDAWG